MARNDPDERLVYLACQHIFRGSNSHVRRLKAVKTLIAQNRVALADILREYNIDRTSNVAKKLLEDEVFDSTLKARIRFPELFDVSPTQNAEREASEAEAARDEANAVKEISDREAVKETVKAHDANFQDVSTTQNRLTSERPLERNLESLYPVYIHYRGQHMLLTTIQNLLEAACFEFAQRHFPQLLTDHGWDCSEAVELTEWTKVLPQYSALLMQSLRKPIDDVVVLLRELRHSAVHRLRKTATGVERLAENAQLFLEALQDSFRSEQVSCLRRELQGAIEELKRNKDLLEGRWLAQVKEIQHQRAELDAMERSAKETMISEDSRCTNDIGEGLERFIQEVMKRKEERGENELVIYSDSLESEEEFLEAVAAAPQF